MDFQKEVIEESFKRPVIVDFWAPWCDPCLLLEPILNELEKEAAGKWKLIKINSDIEIEIASEYHIKAVPSIRIFYQGHIIGSYNGLMWKKDFGNWIEGIIRN